MKYLSVKKIVLCSISLCIAMLIIIGAGIGLHTTWGVLVFRLLMMLGGIALAAITLVSFFFWDPEKTNKVCLAAAISGLSLSILNLILKIALSHDTIYSVIPAILIFIFVVMAFIAHFVVNKILKEYPLGSYKRELAAQNGEDPSEVSEIPEAKTNVTHSESAYDEQTTIELLHKYKQLLDDGVITQEEFEKKKKEIL